MIRSIRSILVISFILKLRLRQIILTKYIYIYIYIWLHWKTTAILVFTIFLLDTE